MLFDQILWQIQCLTKKDELSSDELVFIFSNKIDYGHGLENIKLFNEWARRKYNYFANVHKTISLDNIELRDVDLTGIDLRNSNIYKCKFNCCDFTDANMLNSNIENAVFSNCILSETVLRGSRIENCKFKSMYIEADCNLLETKIYNSIISIDNKNHNNFTRIDFSNSILEGLTITIPTINRQCENTSVINPTGMDSNEKISNDEVYELVFRYCNIQELRLVNLNIYKFIADYAIIINSDITNTNVVGEISINKIILNNLRVKKEFFQIYHKSIEELMAGKSNIPSNNNLHETILTLKDNFKATNDNQSKITYYILSKEYERYVNKIEPGFKTLIKYLSLTFYKVFTGYGQSPANLFSVVFSTVTFCGFLGYLLRLTNTKTLGGNLYFSLITFMTIGYGDHLPVNKLGKLIFGLEGFLGVILMSIFVVLLTKKTFDE